MLALKQVLANNLSVFGHSTRLMGSDFEINVVGEDHAWANERINSAINEISRVEKLLNAFGDDSWANMINRNAGIAPVKVSGEVFRLVQRAIDISALTYGAFDLTYYTADKIFIDHNANTSSVIAPYSVTKTNYQGVVSDAKNCTVFLKEKGMRISFAAVSKGYAADRARYLLQMEGVNSGVIHFGNTLLTWGTQPNSQPWTIAAAFPQNKNTVAGQLDVTNMALATSVNNQKPFKKHSGLNSGFLVSDIETIHVLSPSAEFADALTRPLIAMGINAALYLINRLNQVGCIFTDDHHRVYSSRDIQA